MTDEREAKKDRATAKRNLTRANNNLLNSISSNEDVELVRHKYSIVMEKWTTIQEKYEQWLRYKEDYDDGVMEEDSWIDDIQSTFNQAKIKLLEDHLKSVERARKMRSIEEKELLGQLDQILPCIKTELSVSSLQMMQESLKEQFERCKVAHEMLIDVLDKEEIEKEINWVSIIQSKYLKVRKRRIMLITGQYNNTGQNSSWNI